MSDHFTNQQRPPSASEPAGDDVPEPSHPESSHPEPSHTVSAHDEGRTGTGTEAAVPRGSASTMTMSISSVLDSLIGDFPDISISKIRFLETRGLITPDRAPSGYRRFSDADVARLRWILTMQRDYFLPLRVIKERLDAGVDTAAPTSAETDGGAAAPVVPPTTMPTRSPSSRFRAPGPDSDRLDAADVARLAGLTAAQLDELVRFGLIEPDGAEGEADYSRDELRVAKAAGGFLAHGIEARHLKAWRVAAEREAGLLEQVVVPLSRQNAPDATTRAREVADELIDLGNTIREAILVKSLRRNLGNSPD